MNVLSRLVAFAVLLGLVLGGAVLVGAATGPTDEPTASPGHREVAP